jgi:hypothetical protein
MASADSVSQALDLVREAERRGYLDFAPAEARIAGEPPTVAGIEALLRHIQDYGGAYAYFEQHGASRRTLDRLIENLLEER